MTTIAFLVMIFAWPVFSTQASEAKRPEHSGQLKDVLIEGVPRIEIKGDKPLYVPDFHPLPPVQDFLAQRLNAPDSSRKGMLDLPNYLPTRLACDLVVSPWRGQLVSAPVLELVLKHPSGVTVSSWRLVITDDQGKIFRTIRGRGRFPDTLAWDGRGNSGHWLKVGHPYAYSFFVLDKAQVPTYMPGKTVLVKGLVDNRRRTTVFLETKSLFDRGLRFSDWGTLALRESRDYFRRASAIDITVYGEDADLSEKQAETIRQNLIDSLHLRERDVTARARAMDKSRYVRAEITAR